MKARTKCNQSLLTRILPAIHYKLGFVFALFLIFSAITGVLLNHATDLEMDTRQVPSFIAKNYYKDIKVPLGYKVNGTWLYGMAGRLWLGASNVTHCEPGLRSATLIRNQIFALCGDYLTVISPEGEMIEALPEFASVDRLGRLKDQLVVEEKGDMSMVHMLDLQLVKSGSVSIESGKSSSVVAWASPQDIDKDLINHYLPALSWEKWILDLHSGSYFGGPGRLFLDILGIALVLGAGSGLYLGLSSRKAGGQVIINEINEDTSQKKESSD